jgi:hypothetical protein
MIIALEFLHAMVKLLNIADNAWTSSSGEAAEYRR